MYDKMTNTMTIVEGGILLRKNACKQWTLKNYGNMICSTTNIDIQVQNTNFFHRVNVGRCSVLVLQRGRVL